MPKSPSQDALWAVVRGQRRAILATVAPDGMPHLTNVHYLADPRERLVRITTTTTRVKGRNLLRDPRAVLHVQGDDWFTYAVAEGSVSYGVAKAPGDAAIDELHEIFTAFRGSQDRPAFDERMIAAHRMIVRLSVDRLYGLIPNPDVVARARAS
jgi:PPOX class probable F420-dependent enzyme